MSAAPSAGIEDSGIDNTGLINLTPARTMAGRMGAAFRDMGAALKLWRLCRTLAWLDIRLRYRGSTLGPFWLTLSTGIMVGAMGVLYGTLFHMDLREYLPFLAVSQVLWQFLATLVNDSCGGFTGSDTLIRAVRLPYSLHAGRIVLRNLAVVAHNLVVIVVVFAVLWRWPGIDVLMVVPALALWLMDALAVSLLLGALCARFRDIPPIVGSVMQMAFFITPVIWRPEQAGRHQGLLALNPLYTLLEIMRAPLLGSVPGVAIYAMAVGSSVLLWIVSLLLFARVRGRIAYWL